MKEMAGIQSFLIKIVTPTHWAFPRLSGVKDCISWAQTTLSHSQKSRHDYREEKVDLRSVIGGSGSHYLSSEAWTFGLVSFSLGRLRSVTKLMPT